MWGLLGVPCVPLWRPPLLLVKPLPHCPLSLCLHEPSRYTGHRTQSRLEVAAGSDGRSTVHLAEAAKEAQSGNRSLSRDQQPWGKGRGRSLQGTLQVPPQSSNIDGEVRLHTRAAYLQPPARAQGSLASVTVPRQGAREGTNNQITASLFICARNVHRFYSSPPIHHDLFVVSCPTTVCPVSQNITVILPNNTWVLISKTTKSRILWAGKQATRSFPPLPEGGTECASPGICLPSSWAKFRILMAFKFYIERNFIFDFCPVKNNSSFILRTMSPSFLL